MNSAQYVNFCENEKMKMRLIYISHGNIPSRWAHTFQMMKMAEAFSRQVKSVTLLTGKSLFPIRKKHINLNEWYGINGSFRVECLPFFLYVNRMLFDEERCPKLKPRFERIAATYAKLKKPDIVYTRSVHAGYLCAKLKLNVIIEEHRDIARISLQHLRNISHSPYVRGIVTITDALKRVYKNAGIPEGKILVWPDAVDLTLFKNLGDKSILRQKINLPQDKFIATYCGNLYPHRGVEDIFKCARELPHVYFLMVGGWEKHIEKRMEESKNLPNIHFVGFVPNQNMPDFLGASDLLLMPYSGKCKTSCWMSPMKMFEYMAAQRPIISTDLPILHKHLKHEYNAILIAPDNPKELKKAIQRLILEPTLGQRLAEAAHRDVLPYSWDNRAKAILKHFCNM